MIQNDERSYALITDPADNPKHGCFADHSCKAEAEHTNTMHV